MDSKRECILPHDRSSFVGETLRLHHVRTLSKQPDRDASARDLIELIFNLWGPPVVDSNDEWRRADRRSRLPFDD